MTTRSKLLRSLFLFSLIAVITLLALLTQPFVGLTTTAPPTVIPHPDDLKAHVQFLSVQAHPRDYKHGKHLEWAAHYIEQQFTAAGVTPISQTVIADGVSYRNVIARFGPTTGSVMVVGAHYDSHCDESFCTPGADDNASGVAGLIELARLLAKNPPKQAVELVAYTLEEPPYFRTQNMGSAWHAASMMNGQNKRDIKLMISLEMIGFFSNTADSQTYPVPGMSWFYPNVGNYIAIVGRFGNFSNTRKIKSLMSGASDLPVRSINAPSWMVGIDFSDHLNYWKADIPAVMVTDTAFMRNTQYHLAGDTYDKLDYQRMAQVIAAVYAVVTDF